MYAADSLLTRINEMVRMTTLQIRLPPGNEFSLMCHVLAAPAGRRILCFSPQRPRDRNRIVRRRADASVKRTMKPDKCLGKVEGSATRRAAALIDEA